MHPFRNLQQNLQKEGWYVGWALPCCQTCAWQEIPYQHEEGVFKGQSIDLSKVLFNHEQDCSMDCEYDEEKDEYVLPEGMTKDDYSTFPCHKPEQTNGSLFCFSGDDKGLQNLIDILPMIKESGCKVRWNKSANTRIYIYWD